MSTSLHLHKALRKPETRAMLRRLNHVTRRLDHANCADRDALSRAAAELLLFLVSGVAAYVVGLALGALLAVLA